MAENLVPRTQTLIAPGDLYDALYLAWGDPKPSRESLLVLLGQSAFETGWWHFCWNYNLGNVKHVDGDGHSYYQVRCNEYVGGKLVWFDPPNPATSFVAYPTLTEGAAAYLSILRGRFHTAWPAVLAGDPAAFCHELKLAHYYTDNEAHYTANVVGCYRRLDANIPHDAGPSPQLLASEAAALAGDPQP